MRGSIIKEFVLRRLKGEKMRSTKNILVNFLGYSFLLKITDKPYFITLSQLQKITKTLLVDLIFLMQVSPFKRRKPCIFITDPLKAIAN